MNCVMIGTLALQLSAIAAPVHASVPVTGYIKAPAMLRHAAHCLAVKRFLPSTNKAKRSLGYRLDVRSRPGEKVLYVVDYPGDSRFGGFVYVVFIEGDGGSKVFNIQNNAKFRSSRDGKDIRFVEEALGGVGTHNDIVAAIKEIALKPVFTLSTKEIARADASIGCQSYNNPDTER